MILMYWQYIAMIVLLIWGALIYLSYNAYIYQKNLRKKGDSYKAKIKGLTESLSHASSEMDLILNEIQSAIEQREKEISIIESKIDNLTIQEQELVIRVKSLKRGPVAALEYYLRVAGSAEQRSAKRDYLLFALGVILSIITTAIFDIFWK